ncbi:MAG: GNAT family N-acetyltransferase [Lachnospiraceae bacterium]|nr:GNAT family N-acetyltransferase [Lachnospiraceae bacterium]
MIFVKATEEDVEAVSQLYRQAIGTEGCTWSEDYPNSEITHGDYQRGDLFCMKMQDGEIIGAISVDDDQLVEVMDCWSKELEPVAELSRLVVKEAYQNQGIARELLQGAMEELRNRGCKGVHFLVSPGNEKALRSYAKLHFVHCGDCNLYDHHWFCYEKPL